MNSNQDENNEETMNVEKINSEEIKVDEESIEIKDKYKLNIFRHVFNHIYKSKRI